MNKLFFLLSFLLLCSFSLNAQDHPTEVSLNIPTVAAQKGDNICLDITSDNFTGIFGLSFTLIFDANALEFVEIKDINLPGATLDLNFNTLQAGEGEIGMLWTSLSAEVYPSPFSLFTICFKVIGTEGAIAPIQITNDPVRVEIIGAADSSFEDFVQGKFTNGAVWIKNGALPSIPEISGETAIFSCEEIWKTGLDITVNGGVPPYQFNWSGPRDFQSSDEDLPLLDFGVYTLTVTDQNQSPAYATFYLIRPESIGDPQSVVDSASITEAISCLEPDGAIVLHLNQDPDSYSFVWSNGQTTPNITGVAAGFYEVTIVDDRGCLDYWSVSVPRGNDFEVIVDADPAICLREKGRLEITSPLGDAYQYVWFNGSEGTAVESLTPGDYELTVTDNNTGCVKTFQPRVQAGGSIPLAIIPTPPKCNGTPGSIRLQLPSGLFDITWNTGDKTAEIGNLPEGEYAVTITDQAGGCVREEQVALEVAVVTLNVQTECLLSNIAPDSVFTTISPAGGRRPYTFEWSNGLTTTSTVASTLGDQLPAALFATVTDQDGCMAYSESNTLCREEDRQGNFNASLYYECTNEPSKIAFTAYVWAGGTAPYTFNWSNGFQETAEQKSTTLRTGAGLTAVTITDASGLSDVLVGQSLPVGVCQDEVQSVQLIIPNVLAEIDESFSLPIVLGAGVVPETLDIELHWDPNLLKLDAVTGEAFTLNASVDNLSQSGKARLVFLLNERQSPSEVLANFRFTPQGAIGDVIPVILGYNQWSALGGGNIYPIHPSHGSVTLLPDGAKVWPGDTDRSREVDHYDLLNIGLGYGTTGVVRADANLEWIGQYSADWGETTPESGVDYKHIDTDGNGLIEAQDTAAISINWSQITTHFRDPNGEPLPTPKINGVPLLVQGGNISSDQNNVLPIVLGTSALLAENVYGLAFSIRYEGPISTQIIGVDFTDSWLGQDDTPLLTIYRHFPEGNRIDIALVRTNGQGTSGFGAIAQLILRGNNRTNGPQPANVETIDVKLIDPQEKLIEVATGTTQLTVDFNTNVSEPAWARAIEVFPIPASNELFIKADGIIIEGLQVLNWQGQVLEKFPATQVIPLQALAPGGYLLRIQTPQGVIVRRWLKQ